MSAPAQPLSSQTGDSMTMQMTPSCRMKAEARQTITPKITGASQ